VRLCLQCVRKASMVTVVRSDATAPITQLATRTLVLVDARQAGLESTAINVRKLTRLSINRVSFFNAIWLLEFYRSVSLKFHLRLVYALKGWLNEYQCIAIKWFGAVLKARYSSSFPTKQCHTVLSDQNW